MDGVKYIVANRNDGLGGRMLVLMIAAGLARCLGAKFLVHWPDTPDLSGRSLDFLFDDPVFRAYQSCPEGRRVSWLALTTAEDIRRIRIQGYHDRLEPGDFPVFDAIVMMNARPAAAAVLSGCSESRLVDEARAAFREWRPHPGVLRFVDRLPQVNPAAGVVGVHVRHGDIGRHPKLVHRQRVLPTARYFEKLDSGGPEDRPIFLATDDRAVRREFRKRYGRRVLMIPAGGDSRVRRRDLQRAFAEILLLSRCSTILAGPSLFSLCASFIGNVARIKLDVPPMPKEWDAFKSQWGY